jgi:hypothetical protein
MPKGMQAIYSRTLTSAAYSVTFNNIPQNYTDLVIKISARGDSGANFVDNGLLEPNGDITNLSGIRAEGYNITFNSGRTNTGNYSTFYRFPAGTSTSNTFGLTTVTIPNYTLRTPKQMIVDGVTPNVNSTNWFVNMYAQLYSNTTPITSFTFLGGAGNYAAGSTFNLYGIAR